MSKDLERLSDRMGGALTMQIRALEAELKAKDIRLAAYQQELTALKLIIARLGAVVDDPDTALDTSTRESIRATKKALTKSLTQAKKDKQ